MKNDTLKEIYTVLGIHPEDVKELNERQKEALKNRFGTNISTYGIKYTDSEDLIFTSESTFKNWKYYAGFEYIEESPNMVKLNGKFIAVYYNYLGNNRVTEVLELLYASEETI